MKTKSIVNCSDIFLFLHYKSLLINNTFSHCVKSPVFFLFGQQSLVDNNHSLQLLLLVIVVKRVYLDQLLYKIINNDSASHKYNPIIIYIHSKLWCKLIFSYPLYMYNQNEEKIHKMFIQGQLVFQFFSRIFFLPSHSSEVALDMPIYHRFRSICCSYHSCNKFFILHHTYLYSYATWHNN